MRLKRVLACVAIPVFVLALSSLSLAATLLYSDAFEGDLAKWGLGVDRAPLSGQASISKVVARSGASSMEFLCNDGNGTYIFLPEFNLKSGYVEAWLYDKTGDRSAWVDQAYLVVSGPGGENGGNGWVQLGMDGNPGRTEDQTRYSLLAGGAWLTDVAGRGKGWHKFGFELKDGGVVRLYIDDKLQSEVQDDAFQQISLVGFLSYLGADRADTIGEPLHEAYWDDLKVYDSKP